MQLAVFSPRVLTVNLLFRSLEINIKGMLGYRVRVTVSVVRLLNFDRVQLVKTRLNAVSVRVVLKVVWALIICRL